MYYLNLLNKAKIQQAKQHKKINNDRSIWSG